MVMPMKKPVKSARNAPASKPSGKGKAATKAGALIKASRASAPLTVSRPELLVQGSDRAFRSLVHGLFGFFARHEAIRSGHGARIGLVGIEYTVLISIGHLTAHEGDVSVNRIAKG